MKERKRKKKENKKGTGKKEKSKEMKLETDVKGRRMGIVSGIREWRKQNHLWGSRSL